jgi:hypothetical protein
MAAGRDLPHDLTQFTVERALDIRDGFWGLLAHGGSFASVPGRRQTNPGRALVRAHYAGLVAAEDVVNGHYRAWRRGEPTPVAATLDAMYGRWLALGEGQRLILEWPVSALPATAQRSSQSRPHRAARKARA